MVLVLDVRSITQNGKRKKECDFRFSIDGEMTFEQLEIHLMLALGLEEEDLPIYYEFRETETGKVYGRLPSWTEVPEEELFRNAALTRVREGMSAGSSLILKLNPLENQEKTLEIVCCEVLADRELEGCFMVDKPYVGSRSRTVEKRLKKHPMLLEMTPPLEQAPEMEENVVFLSPADQTNNTLTHLEKVEQAFEEMSRKIFDLMKPMETEQVQSVMNALRTMHGTVSMSSDEEIRSARRTLGNLVAFHKEGMENLLKIQKAFADAGEEDSIFEEGYHPLLWDPELPHNPEMLRSLEEDPRFVSGDDMERKDSGIRALFEYLKLVDRIQGLDGLSFRLRRISRPASHLLERRRMHQLNRMEAAAGLPVSSDRTGAATALIQKMKQQPELIVALVGRDGISMLRELVALPEEADPTSMLEGYGMYAIQDCMQAGLINVRILEEDSEDEGASDEENYLREKEACMRAIEGWDWSKPYEDALGLDMDALDEDDLDEDDLDEDSLYGDDLDEDDLDEMKGFPDMTLELALPEDLEEILACVNEMSIKRAEKSYDEVCTRLLSLLVIYSPVTPQQLVDLINRRFNQGLTLKELEFILNWTRAGLDGVRDDGEDLYYVAYNVERLREMQERFAPGEDLAPVETRRTPIFSDWMSPDEKEENHALLPSNGWELIGLYASEKEDEEGYEEYLDRLFTSLQGVAAEGKSYQEVHYRNSLVLQEESLEDIVDCWSMILALCIHGEFPAFKGHSRMELSRLTGKPVGEMDLFNGERVSMDEITTNTDPYSFPDELTLKLALDQNLKASEIEEIARAHGRNVYLMIMAMDLYAAGENPLRAELLSREIDEISRNMLPF